MQCGLMPGEMKTYLDYPYTQADGPRLDATAADNFHFTVGMLCCFNAKKYNYPEKKPYFNWFSKDNTFSVDFSTLSGTPTFFGT